jgi:DNA repair exonuclease SbcCD ATPase subunit|nr:MAG TPA: chromosome partition protein [Caudoviricetes sp.]
MSKSIIISKIDFLNFKGIRDLSVEFDQELTSIYGDNGIGKTTIFDGITWVLFGKDSKDRKSFGIKTYDENNHVIPRIPHEVTVTLLVDDEEVTLCRRYNEKWTKKRGSAEEVFDGHEEERLYNGVPCSMKEYNEKIASLCSEEVFKFITNPLYFTKQKADVQRAMLFRMAGGVSDADIASGNREFENLLSKLTGKNLDEFKREIQAKKRKIKNELDMIPSRIDERKRDMPTSEDWDTLEKELESKKKALEDIEQQLIDASKAAEVSNQHKMTLIKEAGKIQEKKAERQFKIKEDILAEYRQQQSARNKLVSAISAEESTIATLKTRIQEYDNSLVKLAQDREYLISEWNSINAEQLTFNEDEFICPTCKRRFEVHEIESRQQEISETFLKNKSERLERNKQAGMGIKRKREEIEQLKLQAEVNVSSKQAWIDEQKASSLYINEFVEPETASVIAADREYIELCNQETELRNQINNEADTSSSDNSELIEGKRTIISSIDELKKMLSKKEAIERNNARISELETMMRKQSQEYAELEGIEFTITSFSKARIEAVERKINGMFKTVKFKMFEQQINGGEVETCEAIVGGVPFSDLNDAGKINAGLDIINAICDFEGVYAPIVIDNAESVNELLPTKSQQIRLVVSKDKKLVIE